jgi:hypothetical protein
VSDVDTALVICDRTSCEMMEKGRQSGGSGKPISMTRTTRKI